MSDKKTENSKPDDPEESARFKETAKKLELMDDPEKAFEEAMEKIAKKPQNKKKP
jgi:hypothetical protein